MLLPVFMRNQCAIGEVMAKLTPHEIRSIAVAAMVDPRSVRKALAGQPLADLTVERIRSALAKTGRSGLLPASTGPNTPQAA